MAVITMPADLRIAKMAWNQRRMVSRFSSAFGRQDVEGSPPIWEVTIEFARMRERESGDVKALLLQLDGSSNQLAAWDVARPVPVGTMRGSWTLYGAHAQGAVILSIAGGAGQAGKTLVAGDWIGIGSGLTQQLMMVVVGGVADINGRITVTVKAPLRNAFTDGTVITWDRPKGLFRAQNDRLGWDYERTFASGFALDLLEDPRP